MVSASAMARAASAITCEAASSGLPMALPCKNTWAVHQSAPLSPTHTASRPLPIFKLCGLQCTLSPLEHIVCMLYLDSIRFLHGLLLFQLAFTVIHSSPGV